MNEINSQSDEALSSAILADHTQDNLLLDLQAKQIASQLNEQASRLSMTTIKQLENARECAVAAHQHAAGVNMHANGTLSQTFSWAEHHRVATAGMLLVAITAGFLLMQSMNKTENSDAFLLSADLPPEAFVDKGFAPTLNFKQAKI